MGLYVHSLSALPLDVERAYYLYVLDYGWDGEPLGAALRNNFKQMADLASTGGNAVVIAGTDPRSFAEEAWAMHVDTPAFSWHSVNGEPGESVLPALMISTVHPLKLLAEERAEVRLRLKSRGSSTENLILLPLRAFCKDTTEVLHLVERVFRDITANKPLKDFAVAKEVVSGSGGAYFDALILKPAIWGMGVDLREWIRTWKVRRGT